MTRRTWVAAAGAAAATTATSAHPGAAEPAPGSPPPLPLALAPDVFRDRQARLARFREVAGPRRALPDPFDQPGLVGEPRDRTQRAADGADSRRRRPGGSRHPELRGREPSPRRRRERGRDLERGRRSDGPGLARARTGENDRDRGLDRVPHGDAALLRGRFLRAHAGRDRGLRRAADGEEPRGTARSSATRPAGRSSPSKAPTAGSRAA